MKAQPNKRHIYTAAKLAAVKRTTMARTGNASNAGEADEQEGQITLSGYAMVWNTLSDDRGGYVVRLKPGSPRFYTPTVALFGHNWESVLGNTANQTLRLIADDHGLRVDMDLPATTTANDVAELVEDQYVAGMSFSMIQDDAFKAEEIEENGQTILEVTSFLCDEVSVLVDPAFVDTQIEVAADQEPAPEPSMMAKKDSGIPQEGLGADSLNYQRYKLASYTAYALGAEYPQ